MSAQSSRVNCTKPHGVEQGFQPGEPGSRAHALHLNWTSLSRRMHSVQFSSVAQPCLTLCDPMDCSTPGLPVHRQFPEFTQTQVHWVSDAIQPSNTLRPLLLLPSIFPSIRVFSNESVPCIRWPKYWSFSFSISPSIEYSWLISFRMDWLDLLAVQRTLKSLLQHHSPNAWVRAKLLQSCPTLWKPMNHSLPGSSVHGIL